MKKIEKSKNRFFHRGPQKTPLFYTQKHTNFKKTRIFLLLRVEVVLKNETKKNGTHNNNSDQRKFEGDRFAA